MNTMNITVADGLSVSVFPDAEHAFLMTTAEVARGYGISVSTLRSCKSYNSNELTEGVHFTHPTQPVRISDGLRKLPSNQVLWTKAGIIRLGFFIQSERAVQFRNWAEKLVLMVMDAPQPVKQLPEAPKRKHNRLTSERLLSIMADICRIEDSELRLRLADKILQE